MTQLPKLNAELEFHTKIPSTNVEVTFRPFLVKEEKTLLFAAESKDQKQIISTLINIIESCYRNVKAKSLTIFDLEYLILQLRSRSAGEIHEVSSECSSCNHKNSVSVNLDEIKVDCSKKPALIKLNDQYSMQLRWPLVSDIFSLSSNDMKDPFKIVPFYIDSIKTSDESIKFSESTVKEQQEFIESLNRSQFSKLENEIANSPVLFHNINYVCKSCKKENNVQLKGMMDFFSL